MCLYILYYHSHPDYPVILAGNRDEFYERTALPVHHWIDESGITGGKDMKEGGSWLAANKKGKFAFVTNYRDPESLKETAVSRGSLVSNFLARGQSEEEYLKSISAHDEHYNGYNLIFGGIDNLYYYSNVLKTGKKLGKGIYMLSNHLLDTPWPKAVRAKEMCDKIVLEHGKLDIDALFTVFHDSKRASDDKLPETGVGYNLEKMLSSIFIESNVYGTLATTILTIDNHRKLSLHERTYHPEGQHSLSFSV